MDFKRFFALKKPCPECPFLKDGGYELAPGRLDSIKRDMLDDDFSNFRCHKTTEQITRKQGVEKHCAGAAAFLLANDRMNIPMRLAMAERVLDLEALKDAIPLVDTTLPSKENK
ncbi:hypothetical protein C1N62_21905 (plasmid) [Nissabacter sp. SGAir0207]|nr:hypothetical protein C1N62_21905 [Nissabacter sp. SGAir0207]